MQHTIEKYNLQNEITVDYSYYIYFDAQFMIRTKLSDRADLISSHTMTMELLEILMDKLFINIINDDNNLQKFHTNISKLFDNKNLTFTFLMKLRKIFIDNNKVAHERHLTSFITEKFIYHDNMYIDLVFDNKDLPWDYNRRVLFMKDCTLDHVYNHQDLFTNWNHVMARDDINDEFIEKTIDKPWKWHWISYYKNISLEFIEKYIDRPWYFPALIYHPKMTLEFVEKYRDKICMTSYIVAYNGYQRNMKIKCDQMKYKYIEHNTRCDVCKKYMARINNYMNQMYYNDRLLIIPGICHTSNNEINMMTVNDKTIYKYFIPQKRKEKEIDGQLKKLLDEYNNLLMTYTISKFKSLGKSKKIAAGV